MCNAAGTEGITAHYNNVALASLPANTSLYDTAHFFAIFNAAQFDGRIGYFTMKYNNLFWRPITAAYQLIRYALAEFVPSLVHHQAVKQQQLQWASKNAVTTTSVDVSPV